MEDNGNWQIGKELPDRMLYMLKHNLMCDVTFLLGPDRTPVRAHKCMLASASPVFYSMFEGPIAEKGDVVIPDIEPDTFKILLRFVYTDSTNFIDGEYMHGLIYAADKYMLDGLKHECLSSFDIGYDSDKDLDLNNSSSNDSDGDSNISDVNNSDLSESNSEYGDPRGPLKSYFEYVFQHLQTADTFNIQHIQSKCIKYICQNGNHCFAHEDFNMISEECLSIVLKSNLLDCKEETIYESVIGWAKNQCKLKKLRPSYINIRNVLGNMLHYIRFPLMDRKYFNKNVEKKGLLTKEEISELYDHFRAKHPLNIFNRTPRGRAPFTAHICDTEGEQVINWRNDKRDSLDLYTNCSAKLHGVFIFKPKFRWENGNYQLQVIQPNYGKTGAELGYTSCTLISKNGVVKFEDNEKIQYCELDKEVELVKNQKCTLTLMFRENRITFFTGRDYRLEVKENELIATFKTEKSDTAYQGQFAGVKLTNIEI